MRAISRVCVPKIEAVFVTSQQQMVDFVISTIDRPQKFRHTQSGSGTV
ncbi:MAG: hypothetical protein RL186_78 [Pseudomonadota bacterium]